jgi:hypothetical protein
MLLNTELYKKHTARKVNKNISHLVQSTKHENFLPNFVLSSKISDIDRPEDIRYMSSTQEVKPEDIRYMSSTHEVIDKFNCKTRN